jgi:small-conductance mechanosensitive channel
MSEVLAIAQSLVPLALIAGGLLAGLIFEVGILARVNKIVARTKWKGGEIIISSLRGLTTIWFVLLGVHIAVPYMKIAPHIVLAIQRVLTASIILSATVALARIAAGLVKFYSRKTETVLLSTSIFSNLAKSLVFLIGILIILQSLGIPITPLLTALGVGGLAVALALQDTLSNLFAGLHIIASKQIRIGNYVKLDTGEEGYVQDITWRNTTIRTLPNNVVVVPNSKLASAIITNYYLPQKEMAVLVQVGVSYDSDLEKVEKVTIEVAREVMREIQGGVSEFEPFIRYHTFADFSINFTVILRAKEFVDQYLIKHEFIKKLHNRYKKEGIKIPFPIRTVYMEEKKT